DDQLAPERLRVLADDGGDGRSRHRDENDLGVRQGAGDVCDLRPGIADDVSVALGIAGAEGDLVTRRRERAPERAADPARAEDGDPHHAHRPRRLPIAARATPTTSSTTAMISSHFRAAT